MGWFGGNPVSHHGAYTVVSIVLTTIPNYTSLAGNDRGNFFDQETYMYRNALILCKICPVVSGRSNNTRVADPFPFLPDPGRGSGLKISDTDPICLYNVEPKKL